MTMMVDSGLAGSLTPAALGGSTTGAAPAPTGIAALFSALMSSVASPAAVPGTSAQPATVPPSADSPAIVPGSSGDGAALAPAPATVETPTLAAEITTYLDQLTKSIEPKKLAAIPAAKAGPAPSTAAMEAAVCDDDASDPSIETAPSLPDDLASATVAMPPAPIAAPIAAPLVPLETLRAAPLAAAPKHGAVREATAKPTAAPAPAPVLAAMAPDAEAPPSSIDLAAAVDAFVQHQNGSSRTAKPTPAKAIASDRTVGPVASPKVKADTVLTDSAPKLSLSAASVPQQAPVAAVGTSTPGVATTFPAAMSSASDIGAMLGEQVIDMGSGGQWIDGLAREIAALGKGEGQGSFRLSPEHLGPMRVDIRAGDQGANITLTVETKAAEAMLVQDRHLLKTDAQLSALRIGDVTVERVAHVADVARSDTATGQGTSGQPGGQGQAAQNAAFAQSQSQNQSNSAAHRKDSGAASVSSEAEPRTPGDSAPSDNARRARYA